MGTFYENEFHNEPDTDWSCPGNRQWAKDIRNQWQKAPGDEPALIPVAAAGQDLFKDRNVREYLDMSNVNAKTGASVGVGRYTLANADDARRAGAAPERFGFR
jgi:RHH-type proline utilization regulon transcriptional repressor/proline dehydrogenase/delta 1-pyrroline-5-carboxylate dehydrogenase